ncbi:hypothetical protein [Paenibacillus glycanilyticus]|uniref:Uncharacterized protein n=1 Tax=Paenibacillus glycanilyticus TaxID=126569 RepID=A0ABQ6GBB4_9BACL|nr:hypothetical protein [Paenibacillus glycanilyticus]GLX67535.1 hypothetical protein MU1_18800 [Paenibacillus glycanilyticus]
MESWRFQTTNEYIDFLDFHDCIVSNIKITSGFITVQFEFINVSPEHPLNPFEVAKSTGVCELTFHGVTHCKAILFNEENVEQLVPAENLIEMEVLKFDQNMVTLGCIFRIFGTEWRSQKFCEWNIQAQGFSVCWNDFNEDAWYV